jgi:hypothetical protein
MRGISILSCTVVLLSALSTQALTVSGVVTNASNNRGVPGAIVILQNLAGTNTFSDTTLANGAYALPAIANNLTTGILTVSAAGFSTNRQILTGMAAADTVNVQLVPNATGAGTKKILGIVTEAGNANAVGGTQLVLLLRAGLVTTTPVDTVTSGADGRYLFDSLASGRYEIVATRTGYFDNNANTDLNLNLVDSLVANIQMTPVGLRVGTLTGKVTATDTTVLLANAKVLLTRTTSVGGIVTVTMVDSAFTNASGLYAIAGVPAATGYRLSVSAAGYVPASSPDLFRVDSAITRTENFRLDAVIVPSGIVKGTVTDSASLAALAGASVILRVRGVVAGVWTALDSTTTAANGSFAFYGLGIGTYSLVVSKADYVTYVSPLNQAINLTTNPDTGKVAVVLVQIPRGTLHVFVQDNGNAAIGGASVSAIERTAAGQAPQTYNGTTGADGWATFPGAVAGTYDLTVSKSGFNTVTRAAQAIMAYGSDTTRVTLQNATGLAKVVKGAVRTASGAGIGAAVVVLTARAGGGTTLALVDTCGIDGSYLVADIPAGYAAASLSVTRAGYQSRDSTGIPIAGDTTTVNITLAPLAGVMQSPAVAPVLLNAAMTKTGVVVVGIRPDLPLRVTIYSVNGQVVADRTVRHSSSCLTLPRTWSNEIVFLRVEQGDKCIGREGMVR